MDRTRKLSAPDYCVEWLLVREARKLAESMNRALADVDTFDAWAPIVVDQCRAIGMAVWRAYDDAGGSAARWTAPHFYKVRQVRNHPEWGRRLSDAVIDWSSAK